MRRKIRFVLLAVLIVAVLMGSIACAQEGQAPDTGGEQPSSAGTEASGGSPAGLGKKVIGYSNPGPDEGYRQSIDTFTALCNSVGWEVRELNADYKAEKELDNITDFCVAGVDAIMVTTTNQESAGNGCVVANEANIPIFFCTGIPTLPPGAEKQGQVSDDFYGLGYSAGQWVAENHPDAKAIYSIDGYYGQGVAEDQTAGFADALAEAGMPECVSLGSGEWQREPALKKAQDFIASGKECDILFVHNDEMVGGVIQAYKESGAELPVLVSVNGKELGWEFIKSGELAADVPNPPTVIGDLLFQMLVEYFDGTLVQSEIFVKPVDVLTIENVENAIPWNAKTYLEKRPTGVYTYDISAYSDNPPVNLP